MECIEIPISQPDVDAWLKNRGLNMTIQVGTMTIPGMWFVYGFEVNGDGGSSVVLARGPES